MSKHRTRARTRKPVKNTKPTIAVDIDAISHRRDLEEIFRDSVCERVTKADLKRAVKAQANTAPYSAEVQRGIALAIGAEKINVAVKGIAYKIPRHVLERYRVVGFKPPTVRARKPEPGDRIRQVGKKTARVVLRVNAMGDLIYIRGGMIHLEEFKKSWEFVR